MLSHKGSSEWPLVFFTILTQMAVGSLLILVLRFVLAPHEDFVPPNFVQGVLWVTLTSLIFGAVSAFLHLGNPFRAGFAISNLRSSWLSRESLFAGLFGLAILILLAAQIFDWYLGVLGTFLNIWAIVCGLLLIYIISRLYMLRTVPAWDNFGTPVTFFAGSILLGVVVNGTIMIYTTLGNDNLQIENWVAGFVEICAVITGILMSLQLVISALTLLYLASQGGAAAVSVRYLWLDARSILIGRWLTAVGSIGVLILSPVFGLPPRMICFAYALVLVSEILGRYLFYGFYRRVGY